MGFGSGGGGSSGTVDYPDYMKTQHETWLTSIASAMSTAQSGASPFSGFTAVDITALFGTPSPTAAAALQALNALDLNTLFDDYFTDTTLETGIDVDAVVTAEADLLDDRLISDVLPRYEAAKSNAGAAFTSAFVIGRAILEDGNNKQVAAFDAKLRLQLAQQLLTIRKEVALARLGVSIEHKRLVTVLSTEMSRIIAAGRLDSDKTQAEMDAKDRLFDLEVYQYGSNVMGSISGAAIRSGSDVNTTQTAIGGALSGAAAGAMAGSVIPGVGTALGAAAGGVLGLATGLMQ